ncbi:MAG: ferredoxin [Clostridia bacterium]|nr:ferredoxin [Clostridia bacterium]
MKVSIERNDCISCGVCEATCPEVFRIANDGLAEVYAEPAAENEGAVKEAAESCPVAIIYVEE